MGQTTSDHRDQVCVVCGFRASSGAALASHMRCRHATLMAVHVVVSELGKRQGGMSEDHRALADALVLVAARSDRLARQDAVRRCLDCELELSPSDGKKRRCQACRTLTEPKKRQPAGPASCHPDRMRKTADGRCEACYLRDRYHNEPEYRQRALERNKPNIRTPAERPCATCGQPFTPTNNNSRIRFCSTSCRRQSDDEKLRLRQKSKEKHRARRAGQLAGGGYRDEDVFERDGWCCGLCGKRIGMSYSYPHPRSASIDHILPLSRGGQDVLSNVHAAHLCCNIGKGTKAVGEQLRLVG